VSKTVSKVTPYLFLASGSDHGNFIFILGVPIIDLAFDFDKRVYPGLEYKTYPAYHTG